MVGTPVGRLAMFKIPNGYRLWYAGTPHFTQLGGKEFRVAGTTDPPWNDPVVPAIPTFRSPSPSGSQFFPLIPAFSHNFPLVPVEALTPLAGVSFCPRSTFED